MLIFILRARKEIKRTLAETPHENLDATTEEFQIHVCSNFGSVNCIRIHHNLPSWAKTEQHRGNETRQPTLPHKKDLPHILCSCDEGSLLAQRGRSKSCSLHQPCNIWLTLQIVQFGLPPDHNWSKTLRLARKSKAASGRSLEGFQKAMESARSVEYSAPENSRIWAIHFQRYEDERWTEHIVSLPTYKNCHGLPQFDAICFSKPFQNMFCYDLGKLKAFCRSRRTLR